MSELKIVSRELLTPPEGQFVLRLIGLGKSAGVYRYHFNDGSTFTPYVKGTLVPDWSLILRGCSDVTTMKWYDHQMLLRRRSRKMMKQREVPVPNAPFGTFYYTPHGYIDADELVHKGFTAKAGSPALDRIRQYTGLLTSNPEDWPEPYRSAYLESH